MIDPSQLSLMSTESLLNELENRFPFFICVWQDREGLFRRNLACDSSGVAFTALGALEWAKVGVMQRMDVIPETPQ